jgi:hypothetical protein
LRALSGSATPFPHAPLPPGPRPKRPLAKGRGFFCVSALNSVDELKQAIIDYLDKHNDHPKPYVWTKTAAEIFSKVARAKQALESQH